MVVVLALVGLVGAGAPNIYPLQYGGTERQGILTVTLSPGLSAYSFTFG
ncbi:MAG: hypothetical protein ACM3JP_03020 [Betaproteobacteria bacterium]